MRLIFTGWARKFTLTLLTLDNAVLTLCEQFYSVPKARSTKAWLDEFGVGKT